MPLLQSIEQLIRLAVLTWVDLRRGPVLGILALIFALHGLVLVICADPTFSAWSFAVVPLFELRFGDFYLHYPQSWIGLPDTGSAARLVVDVLIGPWVSAWWVGAILAWAKGRAVAEGALARRSLRVYPSVLALTALQVAAWVLLYTVPVTFGLEHLRGQARLAQLLTFGGGFVVVAALTPLFYVLPLVVEEGGGLGRAVVESARRVRGAWSTPLAATALPWIASMPFLYVLRRSATLAHQLRPEMVLAVMLVESLVVLVAGLYTVEASARLLLRPRGVGR